LADTEDFLLVCKGKNDGLFTFLFTFFQLKDPRAVLELIAVMELGVVGSSIDPHFVNDFEPAVAEPTQRIGVTAILLAVMLIVSLGPRTAGQTLLSKKMDGVAEVLVTGPTLMTVTIFSGAFGHRGCTLRRI
jgi:hypothetical protein